jgi:hypothetical protein
MTAIDCRSMSAMLIGLPAEKKNIVGMSFAETYNEPKRATSFAEEYLINGCMAAKGYTETW